jgi:hypothetical protein
VTEVYTSPGDLDPSRIGVQWALVVGGVTRAGNRRARRAVSQALHKGLDVIWLDGYEERFEDSGERVPLDGREAEGTVVVVGYQAAESSTLAGRLQSPERWQGNPVLRKVWRLILRRIGAVLRPRAGWRSVRPDIDRLSGSTPPHAIVYADDYAITIAWHAGRIWSSSPILSSFPETS